MSEPTHFSTLIKAIKKILDAKKKKKERKKELNPDTPSRYLMFIKSPKGRAPAASKLPTRKRKFRASMGSSEERPWAIWIWPGAIKAAC